MARSKYINTFDTTAEYNNYIESALPEFPNVGYDKEADKVIIRRSSPNDYQIWGTTTATENFNIKLNNTNVEVTVDPQLGEFYLTGWTGNLTSLQGCFQDLSHITSIKKFALNISTVTTAAQMFALCSSLSYINLSNFNGSSLTNIQNMFSNCTALNILDLTFFDATGITNQNDMFFSCNSLTDVYISNETTLNKLTNNLTSARNSYISQSATIHYDNGSEVIDYKWQNNAWTPQS